MVCCVQGDNAQVWITSTTLQGDGTEETDCFFCGLAVWNNADVFVGGVHPAFPHDITCCSCFRSSPIYMIVLNIQSPQPTSYPDPGTGRQRLQNALGFRDLCQQISM